MAPPRSRSFDAERSAGDPDENVTTDPEAPVAEEPASEAPVVEQADAPATETPVVEDAQPSEPPAGRPPLSEVAEASALGSVPADEPVAPTTENEED